MYSRTPIVFCKGFLLVLPVFPLVPRRLGFTPSPDSVSLQGETTATPKISELEDTPDGIAEVVEPAEKKPAGTTKTAEDKPNDAAPVEADKPADAIKSAEDSIAEVVKPAVGIPTDVAKPAAGVPTNVAKPVVEGTPNGIAEVVKPADEKPDSDPNGIAEVVKPADEKLDSDPKLGKDTIGLPEQVLGSTLGNTIHVPIAHLVNV